MTMSDTAQNNIEITELSTNSWWLQQIQDIQNWAPGGVFAIFLGPTGCIAPAAAWFTQKALAELFGVKVPVVNKHLKNIFDSGGLIEYSVISILEHAAGDWKTCKKNASQTSTVKSNATRAKHEHRSSSSSPVR